MTMSRFAWKPWDRPLTESEGGEHTLKRTPRPASLVLLSTGAIMGAGLFSLAGVAAAVIMFHATAATSGRSL